MASGPLPQNFRHLLVGGQRVLVLVTASAAEADEWVRGVEETPSPRRVVGLSFFWEPLLLHDGSLGRRFISINLSYMTDVLVYGLSSEENDAIAPRVVNFLCDPCNFFSGDDIKQSLRALGFHGSRRHSLTMELVGVAAICGVSPAAVSPSQLPIHVRLAAVLLTDVDAGLLLRPNLWDLIPCSWPMTEVQVQLSAETSFVGQKLGICAFARILS
ncbi:unnamed protein product [Spirodela intermedia]|uniref:Uncharacterized protein n=1 Tax=Spirodela intermedia TaxID=51605 RepID=A0A7I8KRK4_SPIIN|nr:unnamed protein product [Spirodela intermedia]